MDIVTDVGKSLLEKLGQTIFNSIWGGKYGDATEAVEAILKAVDDAVKQIREDVTIVVQGANYTDACNEIDTWLKDFDLRVRRKQADQSDTELEKYLAYLYEGSRLRTTLNKMHLCLMGNGELGTDGLIKTYLERWTKDAYEAKLTISAYLATVDKLMAAQVRRQLCGLAMLMCSTKGNISEAKAINKSIRANIEQQLAFAYSFFPPAIRAMKPDYRTPIDPNHWWLITLKIPGQRSLYLCTNSEVDHNVTRADRHETHHSVAWRFDQSPADTLDTPLPEHSTYLVNRAFDGRLRAYFVDSFNSHTRVFVSKDVPLAPGPYDAPEMLDQKTVVFDVYPSKSDDSLPHVLMYTRPESLPRNQPIWQALSAWAGTAILASAPNQDPKPVKGVDHMYLTNKTNADFMVKFHGWKYEGITGYVYASQAANTVPFYWSHSKPGGDHFYTQELHSEGAWDLYEDLGVACYLFPKQEDGTVPLQRYRLEKEGLNHDHLYTTVDEGSEQLGYVYEKVAGHIFKEQKAGTVALHRLVISRY